MWDTADDAVDDTVHLSHDMPCPRCGHASHSYLECSPICLCEPSLPPGARLADSVAESYVKAG